MLQRGSHLALDFGQPQSSEPASSTWYACLYRQRAPSNKRILQLTERTTFDDGEMSLVKMFGQKPAQPGCFKLNIHKSTSMLLTFSLHQHFILR